jgi:hypothetical protein
VSDEVGPADVATFEEGEDRSSLFKFEEEATVAEGSWLLKAEFELEAAGPFFSFFISVRIESRDILLPLTGGGFVETAAVDFLERVELW